jgi:hypothetical protein
MLRPDAAAVDGLNRHLHALLATAFEHIVVDVLGGQRPDQWSVRPSAFALQSRFRDLAVAGDVEAIRSVYDANRDVIACRESAGDLQIVGWGGSALGKEEFDLLQWAFQDDLGLTARLIAPPAAAVEAVQRRIVGLLGRLDAVLPAWSQEFRALVSLILLAETSSGGFGGASAFPAWGAILVSPRAQRDDLALLLTLIHESSHLKLFSAYLDDEVVLNAPENTYSSPLRKELRPMNGIYHAAVVLARMACFLADLRALGRGGEVLDNELCLQIDTRLTANVAGFASALSVINDHGQLTDRGRAIMNECAAGVGAIDAIRLQA